MAQTHGGDRNFSFHNLLKMLLSSNSSTRPAHDDAEVAEDLDEPPDHHILHATSIHTEDTISFVRPLIDRKESLLTRALKSSPEMSPTEPQSALHDSIYNSRSYPHSNISGISTAELTSDGGMTSPSIANSPSPPIPLQMMGKAPSSMTRKRDTASKVKVADSNETSVEANLGRKRCISFACRPKADSNIQPAAQPARQPSPSTVKVSPEPPKRKSTLTFVCPGRQAAASIQRERSPARRAAFRPKCRGSPAPVARKSSSDAGSTKQKDVKDVKEITAITAITAITVPKGVPTSGLGKFEESEATRFHEFASSIDEDDEWVTKSTDYSQKITLNDCMKKENAIRRLGEEAEQEALEEEDEDDDIEDLADDDSTIHDFSSDDGNESDNEAGFAESDESDDDSSDYEFWAPTIAVPETSVPSIDIFPPPLERRASNTSFDSLTDDHQHWLPAPVQRLPGRRPSRNLRMRPGTPNLPDSTDFVCGTLDEDRPLEAAYKSCMEQRRLEKLVLIPQDIDPSFPTSDPEDEADLEDLSEELDSVVLEPTRGRTEGLNKASPKHSPKRMVSPAPPRRAGRISPKRLKSPPPRTRAKSPPPRVRAKSPSPQKWTPSGEMPVIESSPGLNISHLVQRPPMIRTKSLPRTPNPFFTGMQSAHNWQGIPPLTESPEGERSRTHEPLHTRGPVDIVEGLEKKRQKRKEKFWRQHCRKAAKEQAVRRPIPGKGAERMKELGLEVAERCRAYGVGQDAQLVLSV